MSDQHISSENVQTSDQLKRKFSAMEVEMEKLYEQQVSMAGRQKAELLEHYGQQSKSQTAQCGDEMLDNHINSENVQTSDQLKSKFGMMEVEKEKLYEQQVSMAGRQKAELLEHYGQQSKSQTAQCGNEMLDQHISSKNVQTSGVLKRKLSAMEEEEMESYQQQTSMAGRQADELFEHYGQQISDCLEPELAERRLYLKKNEEKVKETIRKFKQNYTDVQKQMNAMQNELKELNLI